jgi:hypothetical protein
MARVRRDRRGPAGPSPVTGEEETMSTVSVPDSCRALWPVLVKALAVVASKSPQLLTVTAVNVAIHLRLVDDTPETIVLRDELQDLAERLEAQEGLIYARKSTDEGRDA